MATRWHERDRVLSIYEVSYIDFFSKCVIRLVSLSELVYFYFLFSHFAVTQVVPIIYY
jgi:hypothetical protein